MKIQLALVAPVLFLCACFQDSTPQRSSYLPLDYSTVFPMVRECRLTTGHANNYQTVLVNPTAYDAYVGNSYPLPQGSVVVAELYGDASCGGPNGYYLMIKEKPGYDANAGDWHWQKLDVNGRVEQDGKLQSCASCHAKCTIGDFLCSAR